MNDAMVKLTWLLILWIAPALFAVTSDSDFEIEENLVSKIYNESISQVEDKSKGNSLSVSITPVLSLLNYDELTLSNPYFSVSHAESSAQYPSVHLRVSTLFGQLGNFNFSGQGSVGYGYKEGRTTVKSSQGLSLSDVIQLYVIPMSVAGKIDYSIDGFPSIKPSLSLLMGANWIYQMGNLDGIEQGFWIPFYAIRPGLVLFGPEMQSDSWFGGIDLGISFFNQLASAQKMQGWSIDMGINIHL